MDIKRKLIISASVSTFLLIMAIIAGWLGYRTITSTAAIVRDVDEQISYLQMLFRGINESILTEGTPYSIELAKRGLDGFNDTHRILMSKLDDPELLQLMTQKIHPKWRVIEDGVEPFLQLNAVSLNDEDLMVQYGEILSVGELFADDVRSVAEKVRLKAALSIMRTQYGIAIIISIIFVTMFMLQLNLYRSIAIPIDRLRALMESILGTDGNVDDDLDIKLEIISGEIGEKGTAISRVSDIQKLADEFNGMIKRINNHVKERRLAEKEIEKLATTDKLTQLYNRLKFDEIIQNEIERSRRYDKPFSVIMFDIDKFKEVNDIYGHLVGDNVLKTVADIIRQNVRSTDYSARWGGEEFMIVAPETNLEGAAKLADKIRKLLENNRFDKVEKVTASFGVTHFKGDDSCDSIVTRVDDALYKAKRSGRNKIEVSI